MENLFEEEIMAVIPEYVDSRGNCTIVYRKGLDPLILDKSTKAVLRLIGKHYMIDLNEMKKKYRPLVSSRNLMPIPLSKENIFIPFKTRIPMYKNDGAFGYINMKYIKDIKKDGNSTIVHLDYDIFIKCLCSLATVNKHMRNGKVVSRCYEDRSMQISDSKELYQSLIPATKADIDMIRKQLQDIASK